MLLDPVPALIDYDGVRVGDELPLITFTVTRQDVEDYRDAVGEETGALDEMLDKLNVTLKDVEKQLDKEKTAKPS